jgi:hypothetical protein
MLDRPIPNDAVSMILTCKIGNRNDTFTITRENYKNIIWQIYSDKYFNETSFTYDLQVQAVGPNFTDPPVTWGTPTPVKVPLPIGYYKYINPFKLSVPDIPEDKVAIINNYIKTFQS